MPRKQKNILPDLYNKVLPSVLRELMEDRNITQQEVADYIGKTRQVVGYYCNGQSSPDWETIVLLSEFFNVSTDYLLGKTRCKTIDNKVKAACEYTGLSADAVETIRVVCNKSNHPEVENTFFTASFAYMMAIINTLSSTTAAAKALFEYYEIASVSGKDETLGDIRDRAKKYEDQLIQLKLCLSECTDDFINTFANYSMARSMLRKINPDCSFGSYIDLADFLKE